MKQELKDIAVELATKTAPAGGLAWWASFWEHVNVTAILTAILVTLQIVYLLRKWWREETRWGLAMKRWAESKGLTPSRAMELDE